MLPDVEKRVSDCGSESGRLAPLQVVFTKYNPPRASILTALLTVFKPASDPPPEVKERNESVAPPTRCCYSSGQRETPQGAVVIAEAGRKKTNVDKQVVCGLSTLPR